MNMTSVHASAGSWKRFEKLGTDERLFSVVPRFPWMLMVLTGAILSQVQRDEQNVGLSIAAGV